MDVSPYFRDPDGDILTYSARTSDADVATASASGSTVTIGAVAQKTGTVSAQIPPVGHDGRFFRLPRHGKRRLDPRNRGIAQKPGSRHPGIGKYGHDHSGSAGDRDGNSDRPGPGRVVGYSGNQRNGR